MTPLEELIKRQITVPLSHMKSWSPFQIDSLGLVTLLGADEVNQSVDTLQHRRYTEYLPLLAAFVVADERFVSEQPGFVIYNLTDGITSTKQKGWFTRWLMGQRVNNATPHVWKNDEKTNLDSPKRQNSTHARRVPDYESLCKLHALNEADYDRLVPPRGKSARPNGQLDSACFLGLERDWGQTRAWPLDMQSPLMLGLGSRLSRWTQLSIAYLSALYLMSSIPGATGAFPGTAGDEVAMNATPAETIQVGLDTFWQVVFTLTPYIIFIIGVACVVGIVAKKRTPAWVSMYSWTFATISAAVWLAVRCTEQVSSTVGAIIFTAFLAFWAAFTTDSHHRLKNKPLYPVLTLLGGGLASLMIAALTMVTIPTLPNVNMVEVYERRVVSIIPLMLNFAAGASFVILRDSGSHDPQQPADQEAQRNSASGTEEQTTA